MTIEIISLLHSSNSLNHILIHFFQTLKFSKDLGRYTGLRAICVLGGDSMEKQFALMHENPVSFSFYFDTTFQ